MASTIFKLSAPLVTHYNPELTELELKPATAKSFIDHGSPYSVTKDEVVTPDFKAMFGFVSDMTGIDRPTLSYISASDVMPLFNTLLGTLVVRPPNG